MGMAAPVVTSPAEDVYRLPEPPSAAYLASQVWTADRVQNELVREDRHWPRYEFIDGELLVSPGAHWDHQHVIAELLWQLSPYVEQHDLGELLMAPADVRLTSSTTVQPDVFVVPSSGGGRGDDWRDITALSLVIEVLSPSTEAYDRLKKRAFYMGRGVPEYWVVDLDERRFEISRPSGVAVEVYDRIVRWHPVGAPEPLLIDVVTFFDRALRFRRR